jgi:aspartate 1-decarboxylase
MNRFMLKSKIHRVTITHADVDYEGSLTIDPLLMEAADILPFEQVHVWNVTRGSRLVTYAIAGQSGSGVICANGAAAHLNRPGDMIIIATYAEVPDSQAREHQPRVVFVGENNRMRPLPVEEAQEIAGPQRRQEF